MPPSNLFPQLLLFSSLILLSLQGTINYVKSASSPNMRSSFQIPSLSAGSVITAYINQNGGNAGFTVQLWNSWDTFPSDSCLESYQLTGTATFTTKPLAKSGIYRLEILPTSTPFPFTIRIAANDIIVGTYSDVARYDRIFPIFNSAMGSYTVSASAQRPGPNATLALSVFGPFDSLKINGGSVIASSSNGAPSVTYTSTGNQYFYAVVKASTELQLSNQFITVKYQTDLFACPFDPGYPDYNLVYLGCSNVLPTIGYPCSNYDPNVQRCLQCYQPYVANSLGVCVQSTNCPPKQYYQYGQCYDVIANCDDFQFFGGLCKSCVKGHKLATDSIGSQSCQKEQKGCGKNQYLMGQNCYNYVANCADFHTNNATCDNCQAGYTLVNNSCIIQAINKISCPLGQSAVNGVCTNIDKFCLFYNPDNTCMLCAKGYNYTGGSCSQIICGPRQYSSTGLCVDVSPFCKTFDPIFGNCFTCIQFYFLQIDGTCIQAVPGQVGSSQISSAPPKNLNPACPNGYYERQGTCVQVNPLCGAYDFISGQCTTCVNDSYYLFPQSGKCVLISTYCGYRTYFSNGNCLPVSNFCEQFDNSNGKCISCRDGSTLNQKNRCVYSISCGQRQYLSSDGSCAKVNKNCGDFDPETGKCLSCVANFELNDGGVCCYAYNYMLDSNCVDFYKKNCKNQRPQFNNCIKCNNGYALNNGVFGRCNALSNNSTSN